MASNDGISSRTDPLMHDKIITVRITDDLRPYNRKDLKVSKALLCAASDYFKKALDGSFKEASTRILKVPGCDLHTFRLFLAYQTSGLRLEDITTPLPEQEREDFANWQRRLARLWVFAGAYLMPKLQNVAIDLLIKMFSSTRCSRPDLDATSFAFENSTEDDPLRAVFVGEAVYAWHQDNINDDGMNRLGAIPGFFEAFVRKKDECDKGRCTCGEFGYQLRSYLCAPSKFFFKQGNTDRWHVKEKPQSAEAS